MYVFCFELLFLQCYYLCLNSEQLKNQCMKSKSSYQTPCPLLYLANELIEKAAAELVSTSAC